ncbi:MAG: threonine--tRNA ligase [Methylococcaceae bacterium]|nr:threonine--tRNA ligase [Methylococcaceae bacterium]
MNSPLPMLNDALEVLRHDTAHLMAQAVLELFPETKTAIGPAIENGFYYDFERDLPFTPDDFAVIERRMVDIIQRADEIVREDWSREASQAYFGEQNNQYKLEIITQIPIDDSITVYRQGDFVDLCRGPHASNTAELSPALKLLKVAGAYWRGDHTKPMLQRIYGTVWPTQGKLASYLQQLEEAEKRDHRRLGREMDLFHFEDEAPGAVFWHPNGWKLFQQLIAYMRDQQEQADYVEVNTPDVMDKGLWEISGHWQNYREHMFTTKTEDERVFALKPMNCPGGVLLYKHGLKSYRDLPIRMAEFGKVHRYEPSGALHGLMRVRHFTQDDAHIFCTPDQLHAECQSVITLVLSIYEQFGFEHVAIKLSTRPQNRIGDDATWDQLEQALSQSLNALGLAYTVNVGEGAFYGPKLEFILRDAIGRDWQCGTLQVDLNLPERFDVHYINESGERCRPVMLHRALFGSLERFTGILLEHYAGRLPFWLTPVQVVVAPITNEVDDYAHMVVSQLKSAGLRVVLDARNEKIGYKIREYSAAKVPLLMVVGKREAEENNVSMRWLGSTIQVVIPLVEAIEALTAQLKMPQTQDKQNE